MQRTGWVKKRGRRWLTIGVLLWVLFVLTGTASAQKQAPPGSSLSQAEPGRLCFPLGGNVWRVSDPYGWRKDPFTSREQFHRGVDLACPQGTPVRAAQGGVVAQARRSTSFGNYLRLRHPGGWESIYAHLEYLYVRPGEVVEQGQLLGAAGQTGRATGPHLHFVRHPGGWESIYAHLEYLYVRPGEVVEQGQLLGAAGQTGRATGPHLHFELLHQGQRFDPSKALRLP